MRTIKTGMRGLVLGVTTSFTMLIASVALATDGAWTNGVSGNWSAPSSWSNNVIAGGIGAIADFWGPNWVGCFPSVTVDTNAVVGQIRIGGILEGNNQYWTLSATAGKVLTLDSGDASPALILGTEPVASKKHKARMNVPLVLNSDLLLHSPRTDLTAADGSSTWLAIYGGILDGVAGRGLTVSNATTAAACEIGGVNSFSGPVNVQSGILRLASPFVGGGLSAALGSFSSVVITNGLGSLDLNNFTVGADKTLLLAGAGNGLGALTSTKQMQNQKGTWTGPVILKGNATMGGTGANGGRKGGCNLWVSGIISEDGGSYQLTKAGDSMLFLTGNNTYSGGTVISQDNGYGGVNVVASANLGSGPVLFNGGTFQFGQAFDLSARTLASTNNNGLKLDTNGKDVTLAGNLTSAINGGLYKYGQGTLTLSGANTLGGSTHLYAGTLVLDYSTQANNKIAPANNELYPYGSCTLKIVGTGVTFNQTIGKVYMAQGGELSIINLSDTVQFSINRGDGGLEQRSANTVDFGTSGGKIYVAQATRLGNIWNGFVTYGKETWATKDGSGFVMGLPAYDSTWTASDNKDLTLANINDMPADASVNTLRFNNTDADNVPLTLTLTGSNVLSSGGILVTANMGLNPAAIAGGQLTVTNKSNADAALIVHQHNTQAPLVIASSICNSIYPVGLTKSGLGELVISNSASTFTGPITVNNGRLTVYSPRDLGAANQNINLKNNSVLQLVGTYSIANKVYVDHVGGGVDIPAGSSVTFTQDSPYLGNGQSVFRKTGGGVLTPSYSYGIGEYSVEGGTLVSDSIYKFGEAGTKITLKNGATIKNRAVINHGEVRAVLNVVDGGGIVDLDGASANLTVADFLSGSGTLVVTNSGAGSPTLNIYYQQATFTGVLDVKLGNTPFYGADMPNAVLRLGPGMTWYPQNTVTALGGLSGSGTFNFGGNTVLFGGMGDSEFSGLLKGSGTLVKQGTGMWSLSSSDLSQFTGTLAISNGTFAANSIFTRPITLAGSGTLGGTGTVTQVTMSGGTLAPGNDGTVGTLTIGSSLSLDGALSVDVREDGSSDCLQVSGDLTLSATSLLRVVDTNQLMRVGSYLIATWTGERVGTFNQSNLPPKWSVGYDDTAKKIYLRGPPYGTMIRIQ